MTAEELYDVWRGALAEAGTYPPGAILLWSQLPESEKTAWEAVATAATA